MSNIYIGDTPEQIGTIEAADAIMIDGKIVTREDVRRLQSERNELAATVDALRSAYNELSQNGGTLYRFKEIFEATPQQHLRDVRAEAGRDGWIACVDWLVENSSADLFTDGEAEQARGIGDQYAERVKAGE